MPEEPALSEVEWGSAVAFLVVIPEGDLLLFSLHSHRQKPGCRIYRDYAMGEI
jgi:hypothetical protein